MKAGVSKSRWASSAGSVKGEEDGAAADLSVAKPRKLAGGVVGTYSRDGSA
jgi:hypothetical protein